MVKSRKDWVEGKGRGDKEREEYKNVTQEPSPLTIANA